MVRLSRSGAIAAALAALLVGALATAVGVALVGRAETAVGQVGSAVFVVMAAVIVLSALARIGQRRFPAGLPEPVSTTYDGEQASFHPRWTGSALLVGVGATTLIGAWAVVMAVVGAASSPAWLALLVPAAYFLGFPALWLAGRWRPGGVWVTPTRVVEEYYGRSSVCRREVIERVTAGPGALVVVPRGEHDVARRRIPMWSPRAHGKELILDLREMRVSSEELAAQLRGRVSPR